MKITKKIGKIYSVKVKSPKVAKPKMIKVAINACHGGFKLSPKAVHRLACRQGKACYFFVSHYADGKFTFLPIGGYPEGSFWVASTEKDLTGENYNIGILTTRPQDRSDPDLITVIEELGEEASGFGAKIKIVEIPTDVKWEIEENNGIEWVSEIHRTWD